MNSISFELASTNSIIFFRSSSFSMCVTGAEIATAPMTESSTTMGVATADVPSTASSRFTAYPYS